MIRVRFAPSPTGDLHLGGLRAALFNYIFAKKNSGSFLLRIEDTDLKRSSDVYTKRIIEAFKWCSIESDESLIFQSKRMEIYEKYINQLLETGNAYYSEELDEETGQTGTVIKFRVPKELKEISFNDLIKQTISFKREEVEDFIIVRSDKTPLYNLVVVIDDIEMKISHIIRGEEHISNTPKQILLYNAFKAPIPQFAHLPLILGADGKKLSKRDAATAVIDYKTIGFLPEALCNYLIRLGWAYENREIFSLNDVISWFDFKQVTTSSAMFDMNKLLWINQHYIKEKNALYLYDQIKEISHKLNNFNKEQILFLIDLYKDRSQTLIELEKSCINVLNKPVYIESEEYRNNKNYRSIISEFLEMIKNNSNHSEETLKKIFQEVSKKNSLENSALFKLIRFVLLGTYNSPSIVKIMEILGAQECINRLTSF